MTTAQDVEMETQELSIEEKVTQQLGFGEDLIKDSQDEEALSKLPMIEKEKMLDQRRTQRSELTKRLQYFAEQKKPNDDEDVIQRPPQKRRRISSAKSASSSSGGSSSSDGSSSSSSDDERQEVKTKTPLAVQKVDLLPIELLKKVQITRKVMCDHIKSPFLKDMLVGSLVRFTMVSDKYLVGLIIGLEEAKQSYIIPFQKTVGFDKSTQQPVVKNTQVSCNHVLNLRVGEKTIKIKISIVSNSPFIQDEIDSLRKEFKSKQLPEQLTKNLILKKEEYMNAIISGNLTEGMVEDKHLRTLEELVKKKDLSSINIPYEKEKLRLRLNELQASRDKFLHLNKFHMKMPNDPLQNQVNRKFGRITLIFKKIEEIESTWLKDEKMKQELEIKDFEMDQQEASMEPEQLSEAQLGLLNEINTLQFMKQPSNVKSEVKSEESFYDMVSKRMEEQQTSYKESVKVLNKAKISKLLESQVYDRKLKYAQSFDGFGLHEIQQPEVSKIIKLCDFI